MTPTEKFSEGNAFRFGAGASAASQCHNAETALNGPTDDYGWRDEAERMFSLLRRAMSFGMALTQDNGTRLR